MTSSPLSKIVFIQKIALFAGMTPKKALQLIYVTPDWRETVVDFTFDALFFDPFIKPLFQQTPSAASPEKEKEMQQQNEQKKLELFQQLRKVVSFVFERVSAENKELHVRMKNILAVLFDFVYGRNNNDDNDNNSNDDNDSSSAKNVGCHYEATSFLRADSLCSFLRPDDLHDLIINHIAPRVTAIDEFGSLICGIALYNKQVCDLFSNVESFSAILKCFHRSKTSDDAKWIASAINNILVYNPSSNKLLNSLPVVEAFSFIIPLANDAEVVLWISRALLNIFNNNEEAQQKFGTPDFFSVFKGMEKQATIDYSILPFQSVLGFIDPFDYSKPVADATTSSQLKSAVDSLPRYKQYSTEYVRDLLSSKNNLIVDAETADAVGKFLLSFSQNEYTFFVLRTKEVQDLIINHIAPHVTEINEFGILICDIVRDEESARLFSNVESFSAFLKCFHRSKTSWDAGSIASCSFDILLHNPSSSKLLNSLPVVEAFSFIIPLANDDVAVQWISNALLKILNNNEEAQQKFATPEFFQIFQGMEKHARMEFSRILIRTVLGFVDPIDFVQHRFSATSSEINHPPSSSPTSNPSPRF
jgi:hypothetical protein